MKFNLTLGGVATCDLPPATIAVTRTAGGVIGEVNESVYSGMLTQAQTSESIAASRSIIELACIGVGTYRVDILINGQVVGNAVFALQ